MKKLNNENIFNRKKSKKEARKIIKKHYFFLLLVCLIASFIGSEFTDALTITNIDSSVFSNPITIPSSIIEESKDILGTTNGVLAGMVSSITSGSIYNSVFNGILQIVNSEVLAVVISILIVLLAVFLFWFFIGNTFKVMTRRMFLESRIYKKVSAQKYLFIYNVKKWFKVSWVMFVTNTYNIFWYFLFLIPGLIKRYSYFLVPFILAENPNMKAHEAITLSRKMMNGNKFTCFKMDLSFVGWYILKIITLGLSGLFYSNSYQIATHTEFYVNMRTLAKKNKIDNISLLNDDYLYELASDEKIQKAYIDIVKILNREKTEIRKPKNRFESFFNFFGIALYRDDNDNKREVEIIEESSAIVYKDIINKNQYPDRLYTLPTRTKNSKSEITNYMMKYTIPTLILFFFIFSFIGWSWEVSLHLVKDGVFVNRGTFHGPWLPIYGAGGLLITTVLYQFRKKPIVLFLSAVVLCGVVEYFTAYYLEITHDGMKWWDYSGYFLNLHGRICAEGLLVFGLGGTAIVYVLAPLFNSYITKINHKLLIIIICILLTVYIADVFYSSNNPNTGDGITSYGYISNQINLQ